MSIIGFLFKSKNNMAKKNTKDVRVGKYTLTKHAQHRIVDPEKDLSKHNVLRNLFGKSDVTKLYNYRGEAQYDRIHQKTKIVTHMTPEHRVKTIHKVHKPHKEIEKRRKAGVLIEKRKRDKNEAKSYVLSESSLQFFKDYILHDMAITKPIDNMMLCKVEDKLYEYEDDNINEDGSEKTIDYPFYERNRKASEVLSELFGMWNDGDVNYADLNFRLGLS